MLLCLILVEGHRSAARLSKGRSRRPVSNKIVGGKLARREDWLFIVSSCFIIPYNKFI